MYIDKSKISDKKSTGSQPDWRSVFAYAYEHSLSLEESEPVPHGRLAASLQGVENIDGDYATRLIKEAVARGLLDVTAGDFAEEYTLVSPRTASTTQFGSIPETLRDWNQWVCWQSRERVGSAKPQKVPLDPQTGTEASVSDDSTWSSFEQAVTYHEQHSDSTDGLGFVFTESDPFVGVDLDGCVTNGELDGWAREELNRLDSYAEYSPSGTGVHSLVTGKIPGDVNRKGGVELYETARFFTVTGEHIPWTPSEIKARQDALEAIYSDYLAPAQVEEKPPIITGGGEEPSASESVVLSDEELLAKAKQAKNGAKFSRLWEGDTSGYPSQSEADEALACELAFWTAGNRAQIDRLFRRSDLMRRKWDEQRGAETYGEQTIKKAIEMIDNYYGSNFGEEPNDEHSAANTTIEDVEKAVRSDFGEQTWNATEAALAAHATGLLDTAQCTGLVFTGESGAGKSTVLDFFTELGEQVYRSDGVTPAAFVSHDASRTEEELKEIDLLPRIRHKTFLNRDMAKWFAGPEEMIRENMAVMAIVMDGKGYTRDTGSQGQRGYEGDYRFNFLGASTPLPARTWRVMGHTGNRFVFYEIDGNRTRKEAAENVFGSREYSDKVSDCQKVVQDFFESLWNDSGGFASVKWQTDTPVHIRESLTYLADVIRHGRGSFSEDGLRVEAPERILTTLRDLAWGHALLHGRTTVTMEDVPVCARVALSTIPKDRRAVIRALLNPENNGTLMASDLQRLTGLSRPTVHKRMELIDQLGFADCTEVEGDQRKSKIVTVRPEFAWPDGLDFPTF